MMIFITFLSYFYQNSSMKRSSLSLKDIYGDPQITALNNRIHFIKTKQHNMKLPSRIAKTIDA